LCLNKDKINPPSAHWRSTKTPFNYPTDSPSESNSSTPTLRHAHRTTPSRPTTPFISTININRPCRDIHTSRTRDQQSAESRTPALNSRSSNHTKYTHNNAHYNYTYPLSASLSQYHQFKEENTPIRPSTATPRPAPSARASSAPPSQGLNSSPPCHVARPPWPSQRS